MRRFSVAHPYDPEMDKSTWDDVIPLHILSKNAVGWKKELGSYKAGQKSAARARKRKPNIAKREAAELQCADLVKKIVAALKFELERLNHIPGDCGHVNIKQLHNSVFHLQTKCGVAFDADEYSRRQPLTADGYRKPVVE